MCPLVAAVLAGCPGADVLATSREPLHPQGEYTLRVPSLALPPPSRNHAPDLDGLGRMPSVRLFVERATQVRPGFALEVGNAQGVIDLCRRLDGMPLALELAAARTAVLEPAEIVRRLGDALSVLGAGPNGVTRHQTLRATLEWSHDLLTEPEQVLLRRLSVFSGGFTLEAVEAVCGDPPMHRVQLFDLLARLVDKSLVVPEQTAGGTRYRQLETVRQFCSEKLDRAGETGRLSAAHCAHFRDSSGFCGSVEVLRSACGGARGGWRGRLEPAQGRGSSPPWRVRRGRPWPARAAVLHPARRLPVKGWVR